MLSNLIRVHGVSDLFEPHRQQLCKPVVRFFSLAHEYIYLYFLASK